MDMPDKVKTYDKSGQELLKALQLIEDIRQLDVVRRLHLLDKSAVNLQKTFAQQLLDTLILAPEGLTANEIAFARENDKVSALRLVRERTGLGLLAAKELIERWQQENGVDPCGGQH
jgi:ribosomal protein L7/L12